MNRSEPTWCECCGSKNGPFLTYTVFICLASRRDSLAIHKDYAAVTKTRGIEVCSKVGAIPGASSARICNILVISIFNCCPLPHTVSQDVPLRAALESAVLYLALSTWDNEVSDTMHRLKGDTRLEVTPAFRALVLQVRLSHKLSFARAVFTHDPDGRLQFTTNEIIPWPLPGPHGDAIRAHPSFSLPSPSAPSGASTAVGKVEAAAAAQLAARSAMAVSGELASSAVAKEDEPRASWATILHKRVLQHNVRVIAKWYQKVSESPLPCVQPACC